MFPKCNSRGSKRGQARQCGGSVPHRTGRDRERQPLWSAHDRALCPAWLAPLTRRGFSFLCTGNWPGHHRWGVPITVLRRCHDHQAGTVEASLSRISASVPEFRGHGGEPRRPVGEDLCVVDHVRRQGKRQNCRTVGHEDGGPPWPSVARTRWTGAPRAGIGCRRRLSSFPRTAERQSGRATPEAWNSP